MRNCSNDPPCYVGVSGAAGVLVMTLLLYLRLAHSKISSDHLIYSAIHWRLKSRKNPVSFMT